MLKFCGQDKSSMDQNGRIKFSPRMLKDFARYDSVEVILHFLPEGALAVYPEEIYLDMRKSQSDVIENVSSSLVSRRKLRRSGAMSKPEKISKQGRVTIPSMYRDYADLKLGKEVVVVGVEIGVEIWNIERWNKEIQAINNHEQDKGSKEMAEDLVFNNKRGE